MRLTQEERQTIFNRAVRGLRSQGFQRSTYADGTCVYKSNDGKKCAWGWADPSLDMNYQGSVYGLKAANLGLAARLEPSDLAWASGLQEAHDYAGQNIYDLSGKMFNPDTGEPPDVAWDMERRLREFAEKYNLVFPE